jgi:PAS domain S-box-containing protein
MRNVLRPPLLRYGVAVGAAAFALLLKLALHSLIGTESPFLLCFAAVTVSAWYGGLGPGLLTTALTALGAGYSFSHPVPPVSVAGMGQSVRLGIFLAEGLLISSVSAAVGSARWRAETSAVQLQASEEWYRRIVDTASEGIWLVDVEARTDHVNRRMAEMLGYAVEELLGRSLYDFIDEADRADAEQHFAQLKHGIQEQLDVRLRRSDGSELWVLAGCSPLLNQRGEFSGALCLVTDVSERKQAERSLQESEQRYKSLFEKNPDAVFSLDLEGKFLSANPACEQISGYSVEEILRTSFGSFLVPEERERTLGRFHRGLQGERQNFETAITHRDGRRIDLNVTAALIVVDDEVVGVYGIVKDITERKRLEEELRQRADALEAADRHKDEFLAMLAHELRNPLAPIRNSLELLRRRGADASTTERVREVVERQVRHMTRLVDDLLDVSRITRGKILLRYERLDLARLIRDTARDHLNDLEAGGPILVLELPEAPVWVAGDPTRVGQILDNLIQNAVKFTDPDGQVTVQMAADPTACHATVTVRDTGIGIEPEVLPHVFETFTQADRTLDRSRGGLGLGLALVKRLVEMHGGEVWAESEGLGRGAAFTFWLPLERQPTPSEEAAAPAGTADGARRILVVEDNRDAAETLRELLELFGHTVEVAYSGSAGVEAARTFQPEVVLCDLGLPGMDGYAVAAELRREPATASARLIAVSGYGQDEDRYRSREAGFDVHLTKPVDLVELERLVTTRAVGS